MEDWDDLSNALDPNPNPDLTSRGGHCSALIKLIGNRDLYSSHVTWTKYYFI